MGKGIFDYHFDECIGVNKIVVKDRKRNYFQSGKYHTNKLLTSYPQCYS